MSNVIQRTLEKPEIAFQDDSLSVMTILDEKIKFGDQK